MSEIAPREAAAAIRRFGENLVTKYEQTLGDIERDGLSIVLGRSSGTFSLAELASADHPYATRHGAPLLDPSLINEQTGEFKSKWKSKRTEDGIEWSNDSEVAKFMFGTAKMVPRTIENASAEEIHLMALRNLRDIFALASGVRF